MTVPVSIVARPSLDIAHHRIHEGNHFVIHRITKALTTVKYFLMIPPSGNPSITTQIHIIFEVLSDGGMTLELFEGGTVSSNGTQLLPRNSNRNSTTPAFMTVLENPTVTSDGTGIFEDL